MNLADNIQTLRKTHKLSQDQLAEALDVSRQSISKWELGAALPDITMLPRLSQYFHVSTDALLGLVPLDEAYCPSNSGTREYWAGRVAYLKRTRKTMWNTDYMDFLIKQVWQLHEPVHVLDCGCGYGALGLLLLPLLPQGSTYTGVDFSEEMLQEGQKLYAAAGLKAKWVLADILNFSPKESYDLVISQALLRHVNDGVRYLEQMTRFAKPQGLVVTMECNREFEADGLYIPGMDYAALCEHQGLKKLWRTELQMQNRDYSIAMKLPHLMKQLGLHHIGCRMNDRDCDCLWMEIICCCSRPHSQKCSDFREAVIPGICILLTTGFSTSPDRCQLSSSGWQLSFLEMLFIFTTHLDTHIIKALRLLKKPL